MSGPGGKEAAPDGGNISTPLPARLAPGRMVAEPGLFYVPAVNEMSAAMTASFLAFAGLLPCDSGFETSFRGPRRNDKSPWPSVAQPGLEPRVALHVTRSGVAEGRSIVPLPEGLLN